MRQGTPLVFRQRSTVKSDFRRGKRLAKKDHIIHLKKPKKKTVWMSDEAWAELPDELSIREFLSKVPFMSQRLLMPRCILNNP